LHNGFALTDTHFAGVCVCVVFLFFGGDFCFCSRRDSGLQLSTFLELGSLLSLLIAHFLRFAIFNTLLWELGNSLSFVREIFKTENEMKTTPPKSIFYDLQQQQRRSARERDQRNGERARAQQVESEDRKFLDDLSLTHGQ